MIRGAPALGLAWLLTGCVSISFGGQRVANGRDEAIAVRQVGLGLWRLCGGVGMGVVSGSCVMARPGSSVALINGHLVSLSLSQGVNHASDDNPIRTAGADRAQP